MKIIFFGTPPFAGETLKHLIAEGLDIVAVVSQPDRPKGRSGEPQPPAVKVVALAATPPIPVLQPEKASAPEVVEALAKYQADLFVVVAYGEIVKESILNLPPLGCINVHASLLPKYRGAAPIQRAVMAGEEETGVTIMFMAKKMDAGDVIEQVATLIDPYETAGELETRLCHIGAEALVEVIRRFKAGSVERIEQDHAAATFAPKLELEDGEIHWEKPAQELHNLVRAVTPRPGAWCWAFIRGQKRRLKILKAHVSEEEGTPGTIVHKTGESLCVACGDRALAIEIVQPEGKGAMSSKDFMSGFGSSRDHQNFTLFTKP